MFGDILESKDAHVATVTALLRWPKKDKKLPSSHSVVCSWNLAIWQPLDFSIQFGVDQRDVHQDLRFYSPRDRWIFSPHDHRRNGWIIRRKNLLCMVWWGLIPWMSVIFLPIRVRASVSVKIVNCHFSELSVISVPLPQSMPRSGCWALTIVLFVHIVWGPSWSCVLLCSLFLQSDFCGLYECPLHNCMNQGNQELWHGKWNPVFSQETEEDRNIGWWIKATWKILQQLGS